MSGLIRPSREQRRQLDRENARLPAALQPVPRDTWPPGTPPGLCAVYRSRNYLVQVFEGQPSVKARLSINRTSHNGVRWVDGIGWEDLQRLKAECGFGQDDAVEVFPADRDVVNVANLRHLWVMDAPLAFAWRKEGAKAAAPVAAQPQGEPDTIFGYGTRQVESKQAGSWVYSTRSFAESSLNDNGPLAPAREVVPLYTRASVPVPVTDALPREEFAALVVQRACETEPADHEDPDCIKILTQDLHCAVLSALLHGDLAPVPVTDAEVTRAVEAMMCFDTPMSRFDMRRALEGFLASRGQA